MLVANTPFLPFHRASIGEEEVQAVLDVLQSGWLTSGPKVKEFESHFSRFTGAKHALAVNSGTAALHLALAACGLEAGDEVIIPTMTFAATGEVVLYFKARPVLVDSSENYFHIDPQQIERAITSRTRAILPVHYAGYPCEMNEIMRIARSHGLKVIEDAAHSFPASYQGRMIGTIGDITCFSFYATKTITTGEGGMITTDNEEYADRMRILTLHGISRDAWNRYTSTGTWRYDITEAGFKYNLTDLQAALGNSQLAKAETFRRRRGAVARIYSQALRSMEAFLPPPEPEDGCHAWHLYVIRVNPGYLRIGRDQVIEELKLRGIGSSVHFIPLHLHSLYQKRLGYRAGQFPNAEKHFEQAISLPLFPDMSEEEIERVTGALREISCTYAK
ncbi:MAG TPA: DegT/DnrJ/EryC1/StrS family aminotransferase [Candidatus Acidoferrum sp.]|jgi:perosamine synthetase|nr:DegT/DnrJ/EryC1/StrS family aminotransferase [Candidatus Acidoferrum sp.]